MKTVIAMLVLVAAGLAGWYAFSKATDDHGMLIGLAFGVPDDESIEMHAIIPLRMTDVEGPRVNLRGEVLWQEWVESHFAMYDDAGTSLPLKFRTSTDIIPALDLRGAPQGFVVAHIRQGVNHTFEHRPRMSEPKRYRYSFIAPDGEEPLTRPNFDPVEQG